MKLCWFSLCTLVVADNDDSESLLQLRSAKAKKLKPEQCEDRVCIVAGDPHIKTFDASPDPSVGDRTHCYGSFGDYYLVKTDKLQVMGRYIGRPGAEQTGETFARVGGVVITGELVGGQTISIPSYEYKNNLIDTSRQLYGHDKLKPRLITKTGQELEIHCADWDVWSEQCLVRAEVTREQCNELDALVKQAQQEPSGPSKTALWNEVSAHPCNNLPCRRYKEWEQECRFQDKITESDGVTVKYGNGVNVLKMLKKTDGRNHDDLKEEDHSTYTITLKQNVEIVVKQGAMQHVAIHSPSKASISGDGVVEGHCGNYNCDFDDDRLDLFACPDKVDPFDGGCSRDGPNIVGLGKFPPLMCGLEPHHVTCTTIQYREFREICSGMFSEEDEPEDLNSCITDCCQDRQECPDKDAEDEFAHCVMVGDPHIKTFSNEGTDSHVYFPHADYYALNTDALTVQVRYSSNRQDDKAMVMGVAMTGPLVGDQLEDGSYPTIEVPLLTDESSSFLLNGESKIAGTWPECKTTDCTFETDSFKATFGVGFAANKYLSEKYVIKRLGDELNDVEFELDQAHEKIPINFEAPKTLTVVFNHGRIKNIAKVVVNTGPHRQNLLIELRGELLGDASQLSGHCVKVEGDACNPSDRVAEADSIFLNAHPSLDVDSNVKNCGKPSLQDCPKREEYLSTCETDVGKHTDKVFQSEKVVADAIEACVIDCCQSGECPFPGPFYEPFIPTTTTTTHPPATLVKPVDVGSCKLSGDPHIKTFDRVKKDLDFYRYGDYWLVKSPYIWIQARYWSTRIDGKSTTRGIAVSEPWHGGRQMVASASKLGGFVGDTAPDFAEHALKEIYAGNEKLGVQVLLGMKHTITFPWAENVTIIIDDWGHFMNVEIKMPRLEEDQEGHCGNFNGIADDDELPADMVADDDLIMVHHVWDVVLEHDNKCTEEKKHDAINHCAQKTKEAEAEDQEDMTACVTDCCSLQSDSDCKLSDLSLNGEEEWKTLRADARKAVKAARKQKKWERKLQKTGVRVTDGTGMKCQYHPGKGLYERIFRKENIASVKDCHKECLADEECNFFSYSVSNTQFPKVCMGCTSINNMEAHEGFDLYMSKLVEN